MIEPRANVSWKDAAEQWTRLGIANQRATVSWLRSLTTEESIQVFEDLCQGIPELDREPVSAPPPVALFRIWRP